MQAAIVGLQAHFAIQQARGQYQRAVETAELGGSEGQRLHGLAIHIHQPQAHRLISHDTGFGAQTFDQNSFKIQRLARPVNSAVGEEESAAPGLLLAGYDGLIISTDVAEAQRIGAAPDAHGANAAVGIRAICQGRFRSWQLGFASGIGLPDGPQTSYLFVGFTVIVHVRGLDLHARQQRTALAVQQQQAVNLRVGVTPVDRTQFTGPQKSVACYHPRPLGSGLGRLIADDDQIVAHRQRRPGHRQLLLLVVPRMRGHWHRPGSGGRDL